MASKDMGFKPKEREISQLEREMGIRLVEKDEEPFKVFIGKPIRIHVGGGAAHGFYQGLNDKGYLVLHPSLVSEFFPNSHDSDQGRTTYQWSSERPTFVRHGADSGVSPVSEWYLNWLVENWGRSPPQPAEMAKSNKQSPKQ